MSEFPPNDKQQTLIDSTEGIYLVDAGAGTGKTFTVTRRYAGIIKGLIAALGGLIGLLVGDGYAGFVLGIWVPTVVADFLGY